MDQLTELNAPVVDEIGARDDEEEKSMKYLDEYRDGDVAKKSWMRLQRFKPGHG